MKEKVCWGITDGHPGMISQVVGLAEAIGLPTVVKTCTRKAPWVWLPASFPFVNPLNHLTHDSDPLEAPWPDLLITCGRRSIPYALAIKKQSYGKTFCLHIQNPRMDFNRFDLVVAPEHDGIEGRNVIPTEGAIHKVTPKKLAQAAEEWAPRFANFPRPYNVVLLGGTTNRFVMTESVIQDLINQIQSIEDQTEGSVFITPSFRTPHWEMLKQAFESQPRVYLADLEKENPYLGMLGLADAMFVTNDSVNMMCEANMTGKPLYLLVPKGHEGTVPAKFSHTLVEKGIARVYEGKIDIWSYAPINDTQKIADLVRSKII